MRSRSPSSRHKRNKLYTEDKIKKLSENIKPKDNLLSYIEKSNVILLPEQQQIMKYLKNNDNLFLIHNISYDKISSVVHTCESFISENTENRITIITTNENIILYESHIHKYSENIKYYKFYSYDIFTQHNVDLITDKNTLLVIDEAHLCKNILNIKFSLLFECSVKSKKRMIITSSPFINSFIDFVPYINLLYGKIICQIASDKYIYNLNDDNDSIDIIKLLINYNLFIRDDDLQVNSVDKTIYTCIPEDLTTKYFKLLLETNLNDNLENLFYNPEKYEKVYKKILNKCGIKELNKLKTYSLIPYLKNKSVIFSFSFDIDDIKTILEQENFKVCVYNNDTDVIKKFNNDEFDVIIISNIIDTDIVLKGVRNLFSLESTWNYTYLNNVLQKCIKNDSLAYLPPDERYIQVYHCLLDLSSDKDDSGDVILYKLMKQKQNMNNKVIKQLKENKKEELDLEYYEDYVSDLIYNLKSNYEDINEFLKVLRYKENEIKNFSSFKKKLIVNRIYNILYSETKYDLMKIMEDKLKEYIIYKYKENVVEEKNEKEKTFTQFIKENLQIYIQNNKGKTSSQVFEMLKQEWKSLNS